VPEDIADAAAKLIANRGNLLVRSSTIGTCVAAVLHECDFGACWAECMVVQIIYGTIESVAQPRLHRFTTRGFALRSIRRHGTRRGQWLIWNLWKRVPGEMRQYNYNPKNTGTPPDEPIAARAVAIGPGCSATSGLVPPPAHCPNQIQQYGTGIDVRVHIVGDGFFRRRDQVEG
jgi:hypothetical protein